MKTTQQKYDEAVKKAEELKLNLQQESSIDLKELKFKGKTFRIYKWENKKIGDFIYPKGFQMAEFQQVVDLFDNKLIDYPKNSWEVYFCKHYSKIKQKEKLISGLFLNWYLNLYSYDEDLDYSDDGGRVACVEVKK